MTSLKLEETTTKAIDNLKALLAKYYYSRKNTKQEYSPTQNTYHNPSQNNALSNSMLDRLKENPLYVESPQVPDLLLKRNNPYYDQNQSFFINNNNGHNYYPSNSNPYYNYYSNYYNNRPANAYNYNDYDSNQDYSYQNNQGEKQQINYLNNNHGNNYYNYNTSNIGYKAYNNNYYNTQAKSNNQNQYNTARNSQSSISSNKNKVIIKEYQPNYFIKNHLLESLDQIEENMKRNKKRTSSEDFLQTIREGFQIISKENKENTYSPDRVLLPLSRNTFLNIDLEIELNYEMLNQDKKWLLFFPRVETEGGIIGPLGTADAYLIARTKSKNDLLWNKDFFIVDMDNECFLNSDFSLHALCEDILRTTMLNEKHGYFYRHAVTNHYEHPVRYIRKETEWNKFDNSYQRRVPRRL